MMRQNSGNTKQKFALRPSVFSGFYYCMCSKMHITPTDVLVGSLTIACLGFLYFAYFYIFRDGRFF